ncbi:glycoside hydrolase family 75 protein [Streptomyces marokkonensis]|uniref:glycoside hydrolase family 75 protein n=1 Tax=Streptomyces marokkonensis TaxID=324855 RepID=UPI001FCC6963|nr:glycoside hydrolase family 75 protein [Streptomyces marokkonensis]
MSCVRSISLAMAGAALLAPSALPAAPQPRTEPVARRADTAPVRGADPGPSLRADTAPVRRVDPAPSGHAGPVPSRRADVAPSRSAASVTPRRADPVTAADLLARVRTCTPVSHGRYREDHGSPATVPVCGTRDAVFWKADMDIDCDGRPGLRCNAGTDPYFSASTAFAQSDGRPLSSEELPYVVVPAPSTVWNHRTDGVRGGSVAAVVYRDRVRYAVVGDTGPADIIGEASYAAAESLGIDPDPRSGGTPSGVTYIVFRNSEVTPVEDHGAAVAEGERLAREFVDGDD